jgi:hypothetical protein
MAYIHPAGWREMSVTGAAVREIETLALLEAAFIDEPYIIYHGVHWTNVEKGFSAYGEIDFIIVAPNGRMMLVEQKSGFLSETPDGLVKHYEGKAKHIHTQILRTIRGLLKRFGSHDEVLSIDYLLYCPDYHVRQPQLAGIDAARIVDASKKAELSAIIRKALPLTDPTPQQRKVEQFLGDTLSLSPDPSAMIGCATSMVTRLSEGLATWACRLEFAPFRLRVIGTAGSGKTQLALAEYRAAIRAGLRPLYVCFNRPLADHMQRLLPEGGRVATFHMLCDAFMRAHGTIPDYRSPHVWQQMEQTLAKVTLPPGWQYDVLIVDEGQDFHDGWRDMLLRMLKESGRAIWLEDPMQNLYGRGAVALPGWVTIRSQTNFRSPRQVVEMLALLDAAGGNVEAASPFQGADIDVLTYPDGDTPAMYAQTKHAITATLGAGFTRADIALISFHGRDKSAILGLDALGVHKLKSFTGDYDLFGNPIYRDGPLLADSVYRFKGQSAPAVILTEIDFDALDDRAFRKLFVGMTRARLKLSLVLSERAAAILTDRI